MAELSQIKESSLGNIKCAICRQVVKERAIICRSGVNYKIICGDCHKRFSKEDIELMANMFAAFGGYFGKYKDSKYSVFTTLKDLTAEIEIDEKNIDLKKLDVRTLHKALTRGITPQELFLGLKIFLKQ